MITIIDYGAGNLGSVDKAFKFMGEEVCIARKAEDISAAEALVLPGVGAFSDAMDKIRSKGFDKAIEDHIRNDRPFLGICLGLQMLFDYSEEGGKVPGLGIFKGMIRMFPPHIKLKIPQIGWNNIRINEGSRLFRNVRDGEYTYFVHSYYLKAEDRTLVSAECEYGFCFDAAIERGNVFACQFHPEKSGNAGIKILKNFVEVTRV